MSGVRRTRSDLPGPAAVRRTLALTLPSAALLLGLGAWTDWRFAGELKSLSDLTQAAGLGCLLLGAVVSEHILSRSSRS